MKDQRIHIPKGGDISRLVAFVSAVVQRQDVDVVVSDKKTVRSTSQNSMLWALYGDIIEAGGEVMAGWTKDDLHTFFLGQHFGWDVKALFGKKRQVPLRRSSRLTKKEFSEYVDSILQFAAENGIFCEDPR